jgi:hypothetical protein
VSPRLLAVWTNTAAGSADKSELRTDASRSRAAQSQFRFDQEGRVQLDVHYECSRAAPVSALAARGLVAGKAVRVPPFCSVEGWLAPDDLPDLASLGGIHSIDLPNYSIIIRPVTHVLARPQAVGSTVIDGTAIALTHATQFIQTTGKNGSGVTIGIMSDDVASLALIQSRGELPPHITVLTPSAPGGAQLSPTDEGTMLLEELHALAPGASLMFCAPQTDTEYVSCLQDLIAAGASVVADDIEYPEEDLLSAESSLAAGVQSLLAQNSSVLLFSAAGNENQSFWQGVYAPTHLSTPLTCSVNGQADTYAQSFAGTPYEKLTLFDTLDAPIYLQWADPFGANISNFDLYVMDQNMHVRECIPGAGSREVFDSDSDPQLTSGVYHLVIGTPNTEFAGKFLKLLVYGDGAAVFADATAGGIGSPQKFLSGVVTVGAVYGADGSGDTIEAYSATGPVELEFPVPISVQAPVLVAPDGVYVDSVGTHFPSSPPNLFFGTSAATPNVAAVAALLRAAFPTLNAARIESALQSGATPLGASTPDGVFGYGRVDALGALQALPQPTVSPIANVTIAGGSTAQIPFTVTGTGKLTLAGTTDNAALVSLGASAGAQFAPASCGNSTNSCTLTVTPSLGLLGTAHLSFSVTDGAGRSVSTSVTVTVTHPPPPTVHITSGANQSIPAGKAVTPAGVSLTGTMLTLSLSSSNPALLPATSATLSSGCGRSSLTCSLTLKPVAGQSGQTTLTVTARDSYGQSSQGALTLSIAAPAASGGGGGGGAFDSGFLVLLALLLAAQRRGMLPTSVTLRAD